MKKLIFIAFLVATSAQAFQLGSPLHSAAVAAAKKQNAGRAADAGACYAVPDVDTRTFCLAKAHNDLGRCYSIGRADVRAMCLAEVRR